MNVRQTNSSSCPPPPPHLPHHPSLAWTSFAALDVICSLYSSRSGYRGLGSNKISTEGLPLTGFESIPVVSSSEIPLFPFSLLRDFQAYHQTRRSSEVMGEEEEGEGLLIVKSLPFHCNIWSICISRDSGISCGTEPISVLSRLTRRLACVMCA